jgi:steroid delta-isomerase-like uncharacterized protein
MTRDEIVALFAKREEAWARRDPLALAEDYAENAVAESPMQGRINGRPRIAAVFESWFTAFPDLKFTTRDLLIDDHRVVHLYHVTGTQSAPFAGVPATKRRIEFKGVWLYTLTPDGRIQADERLYDVTNVLVQLGVLRAKPVNE